MRIDKSSNQRNFFQYHDWLIDVLILLSLVIFFYLLYLGNYSLFVPDEGRYAEIAREMVTTGDYVTPRLNGVVFLDKPIFHYWLQALAIKTFGAQEWSIRLFPMLFGVLGSLVVYLCGRYLFNRRAGVLAALILTTSPLYFLGSHYANLDLEVAILISCTLLFLITAIQKSSSIFFFAASIFAGLACLTKGLIGVLFPILITGTFILLLKRFSFFKQFNLLTGLILFLVVTLPWLVLVQKSNPEFFHYFFITQHLTRFTASAEFNNKMPFWFYFLVISIGFFPWILFLMQGVKKSIVNSWQDSKKHQVELFLLIWISIIFLFFSIPQSKIITYLLPIFPALALIVGNYLANTWESITKKNLLIINIFYLLANLVIFILLFLIHYYHWISFLPLFSRQLILMMSIIIGSTIISILLVKKQTILSFISICVISNILLLSTLIQGAEYLNPKSAKFLMKNLTNILKPQDQVVMFFNYFYDVPFYLEKFVIVVANWDSTAIQSKDNWIRELSNGLLGQKNNRFINEKQFWQHWKNKQRIFVLVNKNDFNQFTASAKHFYFISQGNDVILLSNRGP